MKGIEERICKFRESCGLSQLELAEKLDVSRQAISKWETGASVPELPKLVKMAEIFEVSLDELVLGNEKAEARVMPEQAEYIKVIREEPQKSLSVRNSTVNIIWGIFFLFAGFTLSLMLYIIYEDPSLFVIFVPCAVSAFYFLKPCVNPWLCCSCTWFIIISGWLYYGTGTSWSLVFGKGLYSPHESTWLAVFSWIEFAVLLLLISAIVYSCRNVKFKFSKAKNITLASVCGATVLFRIAAGYISPIIGRLLWGISEEKTTTYVISGVTHTVYEPGWLESKWEYLAAMDYLIDIAFLAAFTACLVPTFYWVVNSVKAKKK